MKRITLYLSQDAIQLINHLYALKLISGKKVTRGSIVSEALILLAEKQKDT